MIDSFSPPVRKMIAVGLLVLLFVTALTCAEMITGYVASRLDRLADARFERARLEVIAARPATTEIRNAPMNAVIQAPNRASAHDTLIATLTGAAASNGALIAFREQAARPGANDMTLLIGITLTGPETAVLRAINSAERGQPIIRFHDWRISRQPAEIGADQQIRFDGVAVAAWGGA